MTLTHIHPSPSTTTFHLLIFSFLTTLSCALSASAGTSEITVPVDDAKRNIFCSVLKMPRLDESHELLHSVYGIQTDSHTTAKVDMRVLSYNSKDEEQKMVCVLEITLYDQITILNCIESMNDYDKSYTYSNQPPMLNELSQLDKYVVKTDDHVYFQLDNFAWFLKRQVEEGYLLWSGDIYDFLGSLFFSGQQPTVPAQVHNPRPNLTILERAGQYTVFIRLLKETQLEKPINDEWSHGLYGMTVIAPTDNAFKHMKASVLNSFIQQNGTTLVLFHAMPRYYSIEMFHTTSDPVFTMASGREGAYMVNIISTTTQVIMSTGVDETPITNTLSSCFPLAVYSIDKVLLPNDNFSSSLLIGQTGV